MCVCSLVFKRYTRNPQGMRSSTALFIFRCDWHKNDRKTDNALAHIHPKKKCRWVDGNLQCHFQLSFVSLIFRCECEFLFMAKSPFEKHFDSLHNSGASFPAWRGMEISVRGKITVTKRFYSPDECPEFFFFSQKHQMIRKNEKETAENWRNFRFANVVSIQFGVRVKANNNRWFECWFLYRFDFAISIGM